MKLYSKCISCLIERAGDQIMIATEDENLRSKAMMEFVRFMADNVGPGVVPPVLGSERNRIIIRETGNPNPCITQKKRGIEAAKKLFHHVEDLVLKGKSKEERLGRALLASAIANSMEFGVAEHDFNPDSFAKEFDELFEEGLTHDDRNEVIPRLVKAREVLLITDNAGEAVLDKILLKQIKDNGSKIFVASKSAPVQDDVTVDDVRELGYEEFAELIPAGDFVGAFPDKSPQELKEKFQTADLVLAKGMGCYETLSEYERDLRTRLVYLLRVKCGPVSHSLGLDKGALVVKLVS